MLQSWRSAKPGCASSTGTYPCRNGSGRAAFMGKEVCLSPSLRMMRAVISWPAVLPVTFSMIIPRRT